jgi:hypothetical protein
LKFAQRNASFLQLSKIDRSGHQFPIGTSPRPAERCIGLEPMQRINPNNKKPGNERRAIPSIPQVIPSDP